MSVLPIEDLTVRDGDPLRVMARVVDINQAVVTLVEFGSGTITWELFELKTPIPETPVRTGSFSPADVISDLQPWAVDDVGYNFELDFGAETFVLGSSRNSTFRLEVRAEPETGEPFWCGTYNVTVLNTFTDLTP